MKQHFFLLFISVSTRAVETCLHTGSAEDVLDIVGKKWEPRNPVPGPFSAKIRKVNQNSESRREFGKYSKIRKAHPENSEKIRKVEQNSESSSGKFGKLIRKIRKNSES